MPVILVLDKQRQEDSYKLMVYLSSSKSARDTGQDTD